MPDLPEAVVQTEEELLAAFAGGQPEQLAIRNLIKTMFSLSLGVIEDLGELLPDALAALTGAIIIGGDSIDFNLAETIHAAANVTFDGNFEAGGNITSGGNLDISGGNAVFGGRITATGLDTADGEAGVLWQDNGAARVLKVSAA